MVMQGPSRYFFTLMQDNPYQHTSAVPPIYEPSEDLSDLPDLGEAFPYEVFQENLPSPKELHHLLESDQMGRATQTFPVNEVTAHAGPEQDTFRGDNFNFAVPPPSTTQSPVLVNRVSHMMTPLYQTYPSNQVSLQRQQLPSQNFPPMNTVPPNLCSLYADPPLNQSQAIHFQKQAYFQQNGIFYRVSSLGDFVDIEQFPQTADPSVTETQILGQSAQNTVLPLDASVSYGSMVESESQPENSTTNQTETPSRDLSASIQSAGTKRCSEEVLHNIAKRQKTLDEVGPSIEIDDGLNEVTDNMSEGNTEVRGVTLSTNEFAGYGYKHIMVENPKTCSLCEKRFATDEQLVKHMKQVHDFGAAGGSNQKDKSFECAVCRLVLKNKTNLSRHVGNVHREGEKLECPECDAWFSTKHSLAKHKKHAHPIPPKKKKAQRKGDSKSSVVEIGRDELKVYICGGCNFVRNTEANMRRHIELTHLKKRSHECDICGRWFKTKSNMRSHQGSTRCVPRAESDGSPEEGED